VRDTVILLRARSGFGPAIDSRAFGAVLGGLVPPQPM